MRSRLVLYSLGWSLVFAGCVDRKTAGPDAADPAGDGAPSGSEVPAVVPTPDGPTPDVTVAPDLSSRDTTDVLLPGTGGAGGAGVDGPSEAGVPGSGGGSGVTGGAIGGGGVVGSGGALATGGVVGAGGIVATGGAASTGGVMSTGGVVGSGGAVGTGGTTTCQPKARDCTSSLDNNCNGTPDNQETSYCGCPVGNARACQEHPGYDGKGICKAGSQTCAAGSDNTTSSWDAACTDAVGPSTEACEADMKDEDCDGQVNEGCECVNGTQVPCECGPATTCANGKKGACSPVMNCAKIATHRSFTCAAVGGAAKCWGLNGFSNYGTVYEGFLGTGQTYTQTEYSALPLPVSGLGTGVQDVSAGSESQHACAVVNGGLKCWGDNYYGQVGDGTTTDRTAPVQVTGLSSGVSAVATGTEFSCAIASGQVKCWGSNSHGELGLPTSQSTSATPVTVTLSGVAQAVAAGAGHVCALVSGSVWCWGDNWNGQLGNNASETSTHVPVQATGLTNVQAIAAGYGNTCALAGGGMKCWGNNYAGQIGDATLGTDRLVPVQVSGLTSGVQAIAVGALTTCAVVGDAAKCWGQGLAGLAGWTDTDTPQTVIGLGAGVLPMISVGTGHACALTTSGVKCWGGNAYGQLGNNSTADSTTPVSVQGL